MKCRHTKQPKGYVQRHIRAKKKSKTHDQKRCPMCGLWDVRDRKNPLRFEYRFVCKTPSADRLYLPTRGVRVDIIKITQFSTAAIERAEKSFKRILNNAQDLHQNNTSKRTQAKNRKGEKAP